MPKAKVIKKGSNQTNTDKSQSVKNREDNQK